MSRWVLGISSFYHDAAAAIVCDGEVIAAAQEERFTRRKHDASFPAHAINYCLEEAFIEVSDLAGIAFYDDPLATWERVIESAVSAPGGARDLFTKATDSILGQKLWLRQALRTTLGPAVDDVPLHICDHHGSHAASAFYPSPFERAAILTVDGVGEWSTMTLSLGEGTDLRLLKEVRYPHSIGLLYSAMTGFCGFKVNSGEYKLMGLAPYGEPRFEDIIRRSLIDIKPDGSFRLNMDYFGYLHSEQMTNERFAALFGGPAREAETEISRREMDLAASVQKVTEEVVLRTAKHLHAETGCEQLVMAGGVALNCVANGKLARSGLYKDLWIQPAAGDAGGALGAALLVNHQVYGLPRHRKSGARDGQSGSLLGPAFTEREVAAFLERKGYPARHLTEPSAWAGEIAGLLDAGKIVGLHHGRMEFGPRALGGRSILGDPRNPETQTRMNLKIKFRESFRPFAPIVLEEHSEAYFDLNMESPYMLLVAPVQASRRQPIDRSGWWEDGEDMLEIIRQPRSDIPAVTHVDYSARVQSVSEERHPGIWQILKAFYERTGCAVLVNTSFNVRGEPIVCSPDDAYRCFMRTHMDVLVLGDFVLYKDEQPDFEEQGDWRQEFELD